MKIVKVSNVTAKKQMASKTGKTYYAAVISGEDETGSPYTSTTLSSKIEENTQLRAQFEQVQPGLTVGLKFRKNEAGYNELESIEFDSANFVRSTFTPRGSYDGASSGGRSSGSSYDGSGAQVGNAINNAVLLLTHGKGDVTVTKVGEVAKQILQLGEELKMHLKTMNIATGAGTPTPKASSPQVSSRTADDGDDAL